MHRLGDLYDKCATNPRNNNATMNNVAKRAVKAIEQSLRPKEYLTVMQIGCLWLIVKNNPLGANHFLLMSRSGSYVYKLWCKVENAPTAIADYQEHTFQSAYFTEVPGDLNNLVIKRQLVDPWSIQRANTEEIERCPFFTNEEQHVHQPHQEMQTL